MEHERFEARDVEGTSFLQELGDAHALAYFGDSRPTASQTARVEKNTSLGLPQPVFDSSTSQIRNYAPPVQGFNRGVHNHWRGDPIHHELNRPAAVHGSPVPHWPPGPRTGETQGFRSYSQPSEQQHAPPNTCEWRAAGPQPVNVDTHSVSHYDTRIPVSQSYPNPVQFTSGYATVLSTDSVVRDAGVSSGISAQQTSESSSGEHSNSVNTTEIDSGANSKEASYPTVHGYVDPQAVDSHTTILTTQCPMSSAAPQVPLKSPQGNLIAKQNECLRAPCSPVNGSDQYERPLQQLGRMVSKGRLEPPVKNENQFSSSASDAVLGHACVLQEGQRSCVPPYPHIPFSVSSASPPEHSGIQRVSVHTPPTDEPGRHRLAGCVSSPDPAVLEPAQTLPDDVPRSDWSSYPTHIEVKPRSPAACTLRPFHPIGSTLHYRQNPADQSVRQSTRPSPAPHSDATFYQGARENRVHDVNSQRCPQDPSVCVQPIPNGRPRCQLQACQVSLPVNCLTLFILDYQNMARIVLHTYTLVYKYVYIYTLVHTYMR